MARLFTGFKIYPGEKLLNFYTSLKEDLADSRINWVNPDNLHITLKFLGEVPLSKVESVKERLEAVAGESSQFELQGSNFGYFGRSSSPTVLWLGYAFNKQLETLQTRVDQELSTVGYPLESRGYFPHLTLARVKYLKEPERFLATIKRGFAYDETYTINDFQLIQSKLSSAGPSYSTISVFHLSK